MIVFTEEVASPYVDYIALPLTFFFRIFENNTHTNICLVKLQIILGYKRKKYALLTFKQSSRIAHNLKIFKLFY